LPSKVPAPELGRIPRARVRRPASKQPSHDGSMPANMKAAEAVMGSLRSDIVSGRLPSGGRLPAEKELAALFAVSQPTVREAIRGLEALGFLQIRHGSGVYVNANAGQFVSNGLEALLQMQQAHILEVVDVRRALGLYCVGLACDNATDDDLEMIEAALERAESGKDVLTITGGITDFQIAISKAGHNALLTAVERVFITILMQFQVMAHGDQTTLWWREYIGQFTPYRHRLVGALRDHDRTAALAAWESYLSEQYDKFVNDPLLSDITLSDQIAIETLDEIFIRTALPH
jgi:GntR family transcriptional repressor for pyruvate dehydrogenase complex